jgi:hypothetical protein
MKCTVLACLTLAASTGIAAAQDIIDITPGDEVLVERYVREVPAPPVIEEHMTLRPGSVIPDAIPLQPFTRIPSLAKYAFFVSVDHKIVVVDPHTRIVARILDQNR